VPYDPKSNTIRISDEIDIYADSGAAFLRELQEDAKTPGSPSQVRRDWQIVANWLRCEGRELRQLDFETFGAAFRSYLADGVAPSPALIKPFSEFKRLAKDQSWPVVPVPRELVAVFARLLATDDAIKEKGAAEFAPTVHSVSAVSPRRSAIPRPAIAREPDVAVSWIPLVASALLLLLAAGGDWPYGFYQLLRLVVTGTALYVVVQTMKRSRYWPWVMGGIALLFNPILIVSFRQEEWRPIDFCVAVIFVVAVLQMRLWRRTA